MVGLLDCGGGCLGCLVDVGGGVVLAGWDGGDLG